MISKVLSVLGLPFVEALLTAIGIYLGGILKKVIKRRPIKNVWDQFIDEGTINLVIPSFVQSDFNIQFLNQKSRIPKNVKLLPLAESFAIVEMIRILMKTYPKIDIKLHESNSYLQTTDSFISIGGPSVNKVTHGLLNINRIDEHFKIHYPDHFVKDNFDSEEYYAEEVDDSIINDYGFIIITDNPYNKKKKICVACGIWANGTNSAIQALTSSKNLQKRIKKELKSKGNILFITKSNISGITTGNPEFIKCRKIIEI